MAVELAFGLVQHLLALYIVAFGLGHLVLIAKIRVGYTRKVFFFLLALVAAHLTLGFDPSPISRLLRGGIFLVFFGTLVAPMRERFRFLRVVFACLDRPEDRPQTLLWLSTQTVATYSIVLGLSILFATVDREPLIYVVVSAASIGDGLAEPVGVRFGRFFYRTRALFTKKTFVRTLEGSLTVFVVSAAVLASAHNQFTGHELLAVLLTVPLALTVTEAFAPHTWDNPFLYAVGGGLVFLVIC